MTRLSNILMADNPKERIGDSLVRGPRNKWAESIEPLIREKSPFPISYDVSQTQPTNFSEFTYTEFAGGVWVSSQSLEINSRLFEEASRQKSDKNLDPFLSILDDKYKMKPLPDKFKNARKVCFLPGHNLLDVASVEIISRLVHEDDEVLFKPHPITNEEAMKFIAARVGWNKIIPAELSGFELLKNCEEVYTTSASEMAIVGTALKKKVFNISNFFNEGNGAYHPISRILFLKHKEGVDEAYCALNNIINCNRSGLLFPFNDNLEDRIDNFFNKSLELRKLLKPLSSPRGNQLAESKKVVK